MSKQRSQSQAPESGSRVDATKAADIIAQLRAAPSVEDAVKILQPDAKPKARANTAYEVNAANADPLPQKRGLALLVYVSAVRINAPFTTADIEAALPDRKSVRYWVRRLATTGHFAEVAG